MAQSNSFQREGRADILFYPHKAYRYNWNTLLSKVGNNASTMILSNLTSTFNRLDKWIAFPRNLLKILKTGQFSCLMGTRCMKMEKTEAGVKNCAKKIHHSLNNGTHLMLILNRGTVYQSQAWWMIWLGWLLLIIQDVLSSRKISCILESNPRAKEISRRSLVLGVSLLHQG